MTVNLQGITRIVLLTRNYAIKIPKFTVQWDHFLKGLLANISEGKIWRWAANPNNEDSAKHLLCPVVWSSWGGWLLIMKRADVCPWETEIDYTPWNEAGFSGDNKADNYGWINGTMVKLDYAD